MPPTRNITFLLHFRRVRIPIPWRPKKKGCTCSIVARCQVRTGCKRVLAEYVRKMNVCRFCANSILRTCSFIGNLRLCSPNNGYLWWSGRLHQLLCSDYTSRSLCPPEFDLQVILCPLFVFPNAFNFPSLLTLLLHSSSASTLEQQKQQSGNP